MTTLGSQLRRKVQCPVQVEDIDEQVLQLFQRKIMTAIATYNMIQPTIAPAGFIISRHEVGYMSPACIEAILHTWLVEQELGMNINHAHYSECPCDTPYDHCALKVTLHPM